MNLAPMKGREPRLWDCGPHGRLSIRQIAARAGLSGNTISARICRGVRGPELLAGRQHRPKRAGADYREWLHTSGQVGRVAAFRLARDFAGREPSVEAIQARFECSRATAYRWRQAWREVFGEPQP